MEQKIKPCPFCGDTVNISFGLCKIIFIKCSSCGAIVSFNDKHGGTIIKEVIDEWNSRNT